MIVAGAVTAVTLLGGRGGAGATIDQPALQQVLPRLVRAALDVKVVVVEEDGAWFVSPSRTLVQVCADLLGTLEPGDIAELLGATR